MALAGTDGKYIEFVRYARAPSRRTLVWDVINRSSHVKLGSIAWNAGWRRYAFYPAGNTFFEEDCLRDIAEFVERRSRRRDEMEFGELP